MDASQEKVEKLIPYLVSPDDTVPGVSTYFASTCRECAAGCGVLAETRDGRTIKLEGNPAHPVNRGALCARGQASVQGLYNPDRYRHPMARRSGKLERITWDEGMKMLRERLAGLGAGAANAVFVNQHETGSFPAFLDQWLAGYSMPAHIAYDGEAPHAVIQANRQTYGAAWPALDFAAAKLIVAVGADFLDLWGASVPQQLSFADARAKLADGASFRLHRTTSLAYGPQRRRVDRVQAGQRARDRQRARREGSMPDVAATGVETQVLQRARG